MSTRIISIEKVGNKYEVNTNASGGGAVIGVWALRTDGYDGDSFLVVPTDTELTNVYRCPEGETEWSEETLRFMFNFNGGDYYYVQDFYKYKFTIGEQAYETSDSLRNIGELLFEITPTN